MQTPDRSVLHVLPHPGGGGETYVDLLGAMPGYRCSRVYLAPSPAASLHQLARGVAHAYRRSRGHDLVHVHGEVAGGLCLPLLASRPSVITLHGLHLVRRLSGIRREAALLNLRAILRAAGRTICVSQSEHDELTRIVASAPAARHAVVIRNGVRLPPAKRDDHRAAVRAELGLSERDVVGIWVGSLDERKDPLMAIRAAEQSGVTLLLVGDGPLRDAVEQAADKRVRVLGGRDDVPRLLAAADFYLLTSRREGLSLSLLEAMAYGLPPIVTDLPENVEVIGEAGIAFQQNDRAAPTTALRALAASSEERAALGERARQRVGELFDAGAMLERTRVAYDEVVADRRS